MFARTAGEESGGSSADTELISMVHSAGYEIMAVKIMPLHGRAPEELVKGSGIICPRKEGNAYTLSYVETERKFQRSVNWTLEILGWKEMYNGKPHG